MTDLTNVQGISNPRLVSASTQMFTTPIKPLAPLKPLTEMGRITISVFLRQIPCKVQAISAKIIYLQSTHSTVTF